MKKMILLLLAVTIVSCKKSDSTDASYSVDSNGEMSQQVGDSMVSVDESGGSSSGAIAVFNPTGYEKAFARLSAGDQPFNFSNMILPQANAATCSSVAFSACASNQRIKTLGGCSVGTGGTMTGNITLSFAGSGAGSCTIPAASDAVTRSPNFSVTGLRGATFAVSAVSTGQTITRTGATSFNFSNSGIRRTFTTPAGNKILDVSVTTGSAITVTGNSRNSRTVSGGSLVVVDNLRSITCTMSPTGVSWGASCNCPTAGSWSGSCSDASTMTVAFGSNCGETTVTKGTDSKTVTMDRCQ